MSYYLGIDIGGTSIKGVVLNGLQPQKPKFFSIDTPRRRSDFIKSVRAFAVSLLGGKQAAGIGVGIPGVMDRKRGVVLKAPHLLFLNAMNVAEIFAPLGAPVRAENDARCFTAAEAAWGAARGFKNVVGITVGTGIGGGVMIDGKMYTGNRNGAGEFGHMIIQWRRRDDNLIPYAWEDLAGKQTRFSPQICAQILGMGTANLINAFDPDVVVLGGGGIVHGAVSFSTLQKSARKYVISPRAKKIPIRETRLGEAAPAIGAALLFS